MHIMCISTKRKRHAMVTTKGKMKKAGMSCLVTNIKTQLQQPIKPVGIQWQ